MDILEVMRARHSVRSYTTDKIEPAKREIINDFIKAVNAESGLNIQAIYDEPKCFSTGIAHYGFIKNVNNYLAIVGKKSDTLNECGGYYGQKVVIKLQELGLNSCWVALTHGKSQAVVKDGEKLVIIIAFGYGATQGVPHKNKPDSKLLDIAGEQPEWLKRGIEAALLAPTAVNQQKFKITYKNGKVTIGKKGFGAMPAIDLGIVKYSFEAASGHRLDA